MGPVGVVLASPRLDNDLSLEEGGELFEVEQLVADPAVEAFNEGVLPRGAGLDVVGGRAGQAMRVGRTCDADGVVAVIGP